MSSAAFHTVLFTLLELLLELLLDDVVADAGSVFKPNKTFTARRYHHDNCTVFATGSDRDNFSKQRLTKFKTRTVVTSRVIPAFIAMIPPPSSGEGLRTPSSNNRKQATGMDLNIRSASTAMISFSSTCCSVVVLGIAGSTEEIGKGTSGASLLLLLLLLLLLAATDPFPGPPRRSAAPAAETSTIATTSLAEAADAAAAAGAAAAASAGAGTTAGTTGAGAGATTGGGLGRGGIGPSIR